MHAPRANVGAVPPPPVEDRAPTRASSSAKILTILGLSAVSAPAMLFDLRAERRFCPIHHDPWPGTNTEGSQLHLGLE